VTALKAVDYIRSVNDYVASFPSVPLLSVMKLARTILSRYTTAYLLIFISTDSDDINFTSDNLKTSNSIDACNN
jgi:hypothetical protein